MSVRAGVRVCACARVCGCTRAHVCVCACVLECVGVRACACECERVRVCETSYILKLKEALPHEYLRNWDRLHTKASFFFILQ